jgi:hypothetical protein
MSYERISSFIKELRRRLDYLELLEKSQDEEMARAEADSAALLEAHTNDVESKIDAYLKKELSSVSKLLSQVRSMLNQYGMGYLVGWKTDLKKYRHLSLSENASALGSALSEIRKLCRKLNALNFNKLDPETQYSVNKKTCSVVATQKGQSVAINNVEGQAEIEGLWRSLLEQMAIYEQEATERAEGIEAAARRELMSCDYAGACARQRAICLKDYRESLASDLRGKIERMLITEDDVINEAFFEDLERIGVESMPNAHVGSDIFNHQITIGNMATDIFTDPVLDKNLISKSPMLSRYLSDGKLKTPYVLDLKECGNILIDDFANSGDMSAMTISFIHELVQGFLLRQPVCRVNLCFFDFNDQCKFNRYAPLRHIYANALYKGIIRSEKEVAGVIDELEKLMFEIGDRKLSENEVEDIFEFNNKSKENPQSMHLLVLLDFPHKYTIDTITQIEKIVANGNAKGIYTVIVKSGAETSGFGSKQHAYESALRSIEHHAIKLLERNGRYYLPDGGEFVPTGSLPADEFSSRVLPTLKNNAEQQKKTTIPMASMFAVPREYSLENGIANDFSKLIQIPIGKNGGELQSIEFTSDDGKAHALVIGGTGSGKSNLLHTIILSSCYRYSPEELSIYLIDFKDGVEFKYYEGNKDVARQLPHIALTGLTHEPEDGVAILTNIRTMLRNRGDLFRRNGVSNIAAYNEQHGKENKLPRILVIIDEVQELFSHERLGQQALVILGEIFKQGRAYGISVLWASQTVPKAEGGDFKDKVLSQIQNRICLRLNNAADAAAIGFSPAMVKALNRPERGLGIFCNGNDYTEFRVAFAEESEGRHVLVDQINQKWASVLVGKKRRELFIVGDDEIPLASHGADKYREDHKIDITSKSNDNYYLSVGQDYISGAPFDIPISLRGTKENIWIAGKDIDAVRHVMGYALLSTLLENKTNADFADSSEASIYYFNGEIADQHRDALYNTLSRKYTKQISVLENSEEFVNAMIALFKIRRERFAHVARTHTPIFVFAHKLQILAEMFANTKTYSVSDEEKEVASSSPTAVINGFGGPSGFGGAGSFSLGGSTASKGNKLTFCDIMKELVARGADVGIHFVMSFNDPSAIPELRDELKKASCKIVLTGVSNDAIGQMTDSYLLRDRVPNKDGLAFCYRGDEMAKFKIYQYDPDTEGDWLSGLIAKYGD